MGMNIILPLIMGIAMTVIIGSQVAPSFVEQMKVAKVENRTISNQNLIKDAIVRYIKMEGKIPKDVAELKAFGLLKDYHGINLFDGVYKFYIDKEKGTLKISTKINDNVAGKYFSNSFKFPNKPICVGELVDGLCESKEWETFYLLDEETFKALPKLGSLEWIKDEYSKENLGNKVNPPKVGEKVYIIPDGDIPEGEEIIVEVYDCIADDCATNPDNLQKVENKAVGGIGSETGVRISNLDIPYHTWNETEKKLERKEYKHEKVHCEKVDENLLGEEVFVINENKKQPEFVWVAPDDVLEIQRKIFDPNLNSIWAEITTEPIFEPNNICTSNVTSMEVMFSDKITFNKPLSRWDTSNVTNMKWMFDNASSFNQPLNFDTSNVTIMYSMFGRANNFNEPLNWNVSNVTSMFKMFADTKAFNQPLNWNTSNVTTMQDMFYRAIEFNQAINFDTSNVTNMFFMFSKAKNFNQPLNFNTSNVTNMGYMFDGASAFNQDISSWCVIQLNKPTVFNRGSPLQLSFHPNWGEPCL